MKYDRFDFEQQLLDCWNITTDIDTLFKAVGDRPTPLTEDEIMNTLLGIKQLYELKFEHLFEMFEESINDKPTFGGSITRVEVIDHTEDGEGRAFTKRTKEAMQVSYQLQDNDRTMKLFLK